MKKIIFYIFAIIFASCNTEFINLLPKSTVSVDVLYKTDKDFQDAVIGGYSVLQSQYVNMYIYADMRGDDSEQLVVKADAQSESDLFTIASTSGTINSTWQNYYRLIYRVNTVLDKIKDADPTVVINKDQHIGEAKFLRALAYFDLVRIFGDVPLVMIPITAMEALNTPREKVDAVYELIISDFMEAEQLLPLSYSGTNVGRATSGAAKALLGKVYMTLGDFAKAESKLQEITTMGYSLLPNYNDLFDYSKDEHHSEYIFDIEYASGNNVSNSMTNRFAPNEGVFLQFSGIAGIGGEANSPTDELRNLFENHDKRKDVSVAVFGGWINADGNFVQFNNAGTNKSYTKKYFAKVPTSDDSPANWKVTRYADVILMYAEALNENNKTSEALTWLNKIRIRAGVSEYSGLSKEEIREAIYTERRLELCFEGHRWFDLLRTGKALENEVLKGKGIQPMHLLFPVPWSQVQVVNDRSIFWQNEGY